MIFLLVLEDLGVLRDGVALHLRDVSRVSPRDLADLTLVFETIAIENPVAANAWRGGDEFGRTVVE